ncbi:MAG: serine/threonine protein kinase, partial [Candidatus Hydrothermia bacterium]
MPIEPGCVLSGKYEIKKPIGKGTITEVYLAYHKALSKNVVIKVLFPHIAADRDLLRRFVSEVEAVAALEAHPNVAWVLDLDKDGRWIYYVMDFYPYSLKQMLTEAGKLTPEDTVRVTYQILQALKFAHSNRILHKDIKPQNIMFKEDGVAVLADFGIGELAREAVQKLKITQLLPSPAYLSPEHIRNPKAIDATSDIYALGAVMYEMLTGEPPFKGDIKTVYSMKFLGKFTPIRELAPGVPEELAKIAEKAMATDPKQRYGSADEFL